MISFVQRSSLEIVSYADTSGRSYRGKFKLQLNPISISVTRSTDNLKEDKDAEGSATKATETFQPAKYTFKFTIDDSGVIDHLPLPHSRGITESIRKLEYLTIKPDYESHKNPFVYLHWGTTFKYAYYGQVSAMKYNYTLFDINGDPIRAEITLTITEVDASFNDSRNFNSPDITRMPTIKDKDNLVKFSIDSYDDKNFYIRIAEINNLSSIRDLKNGRKILLPPIKK